jgi:hypothetical protein
MSEIIIILYSRYNTVVCYLSNLVIENISVLQITVIAEYELNNLIIMRYVIITIVKQILSKNVEMTAASLHFTI